MSYLIIFFHQGEKNRIGGGIMLYQPELFVYVMFLPVVFLVVIPVMLSLTRVAIGVVKTSKAPEFEQGFEGEALAEA